MYQFTFPEDGNTVQVYHVDAMDMASKIPDKHPYGTTSVIYFAVYLMFYSYDRLYFVAQNFIYGISKFQIKFGIWVNMVYNINLTNLCVYQVLYILIYHTVWACFLMTHNLHSDNYRKD